jgi:hypothetical protein
VSGCRFDADALHNLFRLATKGYLPVEMFDNVSVTATNGGKTLSCRSTEELAMADMSLAIANMTIYMHQADRTVLVKFGRRSVFISVTGADETWVLGRFTEITDYLREHRTRYGRFQDNPGQMATIAYAYTGCAFVGFASYLMSIQAHPSPTTVGFFWLLFLAFSLMPAVVMYDLIFKPTAIRFGSGGRKAAAHDSTVINQGWAVIGLTAVLVVIGVITLVALFAK